MHRVVTAAVAVVALTFVAAAAADPREGARKEAPKPGSHVDRPHSHGDGPAPTGPIARNFRVLGHHDLGLEDSNGDVWAHGRYAYVGTWAAPCTGRGVKVLDIANLRRPKLIGTVASREGTSAEDMVVRSVSTPHFRGDLLAVGIQRCGEDPALDGQKFGLELWDVTNAYHPRKLSELGLNTGGGGVHELDLFERGGRVYALLALPFSEWFDPVPGGDFRIVDVTNPQAPLQVGEWGAAANGLSPGPFFGQGSFGARFAHSARASHDGMKAFVSYWDLGVLTLDLTDLSNPTLVGRTKYAPDDDGDAHSVAEYTVGGRTFLLQNDEDYDPRSPAHILYGHGGKGIGTESPGAPALWLQPGHRVTGAVVAAANEGCSAADYPASTAGRIAVVKTLVDEPAACLQQEQEAAAEAAGAIAVVHDVDSETTSPQWFDFGDVGIPVLFTDHETALGMLAAGAATLQAQPPTSGFLRVFDAASGEQVAKFDDLPGVRGLPAPPGTWSIHNNEVLGDRTYASWYAAGIVALDLGPLARATPGDPRLVGQFVPPGAPSPVNPDAGGIPDVWGVFVRHDGVVFASDINGGLWIVRPTGAAAPTGR
jgi:hypothetical protein